MTVMTMAVTTVTPRLAKSDPPVRSRVIESRAMKLRAVLALSSLLVSTALIACGPPPNANTAKKVGSDARTDDRSPTALSDVKFQESPRGGDPKTVGCADGQREGFADMAKFPTIAGCLGIWNEAMTLRKGQTSKACGDDLDLCASPADVCAEGWHVCARDGDYKDLSERVDDQQCSDGAGPGKFVAAISHVKKKKECAPAPGPTTRYPCLKEGWGAEPVCCGQGCGKGNCRDAVWAKKTRISQGVSQGCGAVTSDRNGGILCCKDSEGAAKPMVLPTRVAPPEGDPAAPADGSEPTGATGDAATGDTAKAEDKKADAKTEDKKADAKAEDKD
jgi:hypothetical protein